ncbi:precorrin-3B synthase [Williamsia sterculiae]|uniref:Precorrin-3B synthase n=1 Tax=Williamsia sterculiae TaxID=1344003 RepID=A0A1N7ENN0_9NOCA|nr:precorrin-3B synthase [Williamsia sterculiae]SIR89693.1 precorrin-3B synthase [Williamsia sterculiae]
MTRASDRCPGVFSTHRAADGRVARIRLPGGRLRPDQLDVLARLADDHGDGHLELTSRGNVQLRALPDEAVDDVAVAITAAELVPSADHDRTRNLVVSPLTGRIGGLADVRPVADALDASMSAHPVMPLLSGRFWFGLDDGRGDVLALRPDLVAIAVDDRFADLAIGGRPVGRRLQWAEVPEALMSVAAAFVDVADGAWRIADLEAGARVQVVEAATGFGSGRDVAGSPPTPDRTPLVGWFDQDSPRHNSDEGNGDGGSVLLGAVVPLGRIPARLARFVAAVDHPVVITPHREILLCDLTPGVADTVIRVLAPMGLIFDADSPWVTTTACIGAPGCAKAFADVRTDAVDAVHDDPLPADRHRHWVGCDRACGSPRESHDLIRATADGYVHDSIDR